jgi:arylsulfatase A-like enzyme|tara:strand:- start:8606 stop:9952 length:1347 start_codon:yes stop_codon:yes gene_type:complete
MKPNILFLVIDSLRADKLSNSNKKSVTPNLDSLKHDGCYFPQAISASDGTNVSLGSIFTSQHPFNHKITWYENYSNAKKNWSLFKTHGYNLYATVPDMPFLDTITSDFNDRDLVAGTPYLRIFEGFGKKILSRLSSIKNSAPWFYYVHIMDLHIAKKLPNEYTNNKFALNSWEQKLAVIDTWIEKILSEVNLENTLVVLTADHGEFDHDLDIDYGEMPKLQKSLKFFKAKSPKSVESLGVKFFVSLRERKRKRALDKIQKNLEQKGDDQELRNISTRGADKLFDDALRVPLVFSGFNLKHNEISQQVRHVDILPTIFELSGITHNQKFDGVSLLPLINNRSFDEIPAYIESVPDMNHERGNAIGIRTSQYKYYRSREDPKQNIFLFNLITDPNEMSNLANKNPDLVKMFEKTLNDIKLNQSPSKNTEKMSDEKIAKAKQILKELGYDN